MKHNNRACAIISINAIENNIKAIRRYVSPSAKILGVVKADAYGHGVYQVARVLLENGADALGVACLDEAVQLRTSGFDCQILILGHSTGEDAEMLVKYDITPACYELSFAKAMADASRKLGKTSKIHIKIDTGMGRIGYGYGDNEEENEKTISSICETASLSGVEIDGIFTHFAVADDDDAYTEQQFRRFCDLCSKLEQKGINVGTKHCCNSAGLIRFPSMHLDMVRPGIILYGQQPSSFVDCSELNLMPAMSFKATISNLKTIEKGASVSYGRKFVAERACKIATIPVGYADGYSRVLSNKAQVLAGGKLCDIVGNICMDQCMIDVTDVNTIAIGDEVILFGNGDNIELPVESLAEKMGTISYEILCVIGKRIPRIYITDGVETAMHNYLLNSPVSD